MLDWFRQVFDDAAQNRRGRVNADLLKDDRVDDRFPERRITRRLDAAHARRDRIQPRNRLDRTIERPQIVFGLQHPYRQRRRIEIGVAKRAHVERRVALRLPDDHQRAAVRANETVLRAERVDNICREPPQRVCGEVETEGSANRNRCHASRLPRILARVAAHDR